MIDKMLAQAEVIAKELCVKSQQVVMAIRLLDEGATVPFIARYRKEATSGLSDVQLRNLADRLYYLRELEDRKEAILNAIRLQDKLTDTLKNAILAASTKARLEDIYLPYRQKRNSKAQLARDAGLEPLARALWQEPHKAPEEYAQSYVNQDLGIDSIATALDGARHILMEMFSENAELIDELRQYLWKHGVLTSVPAKGKNLSGSKFADYAAYSELVHKIPSHRALALFRGRRESQLQLSINLPNDHDYGVTQLMSFWSINVVANAAYEWLLETARLTWKTKLFNKLELELLARLREIADVDAIHVFARNLRDLLLAAPAGPKVTIGLDPGIRTGVKVAVIDATGKLLDYTTIFPTAPHNEWHESITTLARLVVKYNVTLISIGNGTGSRETERVVSDLLKTYPDLALIKVLVNEAGASVYSASELASLEFPDVDVSIRGAISIARRLQDPLAELVKIDPKSIGVGQYQHDINQPRLVRSLQGVVEDCVNAVGVDLNTASASLLTYVSGIGAAVAKNLVQYRDEHGPFRQREQVKEVARVSEKVFQQAAGFLRVRQGDNPLDASGVHPESYVVVEKILAKNNVELANVIGNGAFLQSMNAADYVDENHGLPTIKDILHELEKPGHDPRPVFKSITFKEGIEDLKQLEEGMILDGIVSNVTNFGAFVDIGVHQDGLIHISAMRDKFVKDPRDVVKAGDIVQVRVIEVDKVRRRVGLSMRITESVAIPSARPEKKLAVKAVVVEKKHPHTRISKTKPPVDIKKPAARKTVLFNTSMADALSKLKQKS